VNGQRPKITLPKEGAFKRHFKALFHYKKSVYFKNGYYNSAYLKGKEDNPNFIGLAIYTHL
jgi:hypothetical protein